MAPYYMGPDGGQINPDRYYDDNEPETTLIDDLIATVDRLLDYRKRSGAMNFQLEKADDFLNKLRAIRDEMRGDESPEYDDPTRAFKSTPTDPGPSRVEMLKRFAASGNVRAQQMLKEIGDEQ